MHIQFLGHSALLIDTGDHRVLIDPFIEGNPVCPVSLDDVLARDVGTVVLTHAHGDHWGSTMDFARAGATVVGTAEIAGYAAKQGAANVVGANIGGTVRFAWGSVRFTPAWHSSSFPDGTYGGMPTGVVVQIGDQRLYHAGDTCLFSDMKLIGELGLDVAFLPIGDHFTMGPEEAARCLELLRPKLAVPIHFGTFGPLTGDPDVFSAGARDRGVEVRVLAPGETLER